MPKRTQVMSVLPWVGGLNTSTQESMIPAQELVIADNVTFGSSNVKLKRDGIDHDWDSDLYEITSITTVADVAGSLDGDYFLLHDSGGSVGVWFDVDDNGTVIPAGAAAATRAIEITTVVTGDSANTVATKVAAILNADAQYTATATTNVITVTDVATGLRDIPLAATSGFTIVTSNAGVSPAELISLEDYFFDSGLIRESFLTSIDTDANITAYAKDTGQRTLLTWGQEVTDITTDAKANFGTSSYFTLFSAEDVMQYYVWFDKSGADADPALGAPYDAGIEVDISAATTAAQVATALASAIDASADFTAVAVGSVVTVTTVGRGITTDAVDVNVVSGGAAAFNIDVTTEGAGPWTSTITLGSQLTLNNLQLFAVDGANNAIKYWDGTSDAAFFLSEHPLYTTGDALPPNASILSEHLGRVWTNDKNNKDRLHFSETFNPFKWQGFGDSGAIDIGIGDGDPTGIIGIFPTFRGELFVQKKTKLYRISGQYPETFTVQLVSSSIGGESHNAIIAVDQNEIYWASPRGIHSLTTTDSFGGFSSNFISKKIQDTYNEDVNPSNRYRMQGAYLAEINSIAFALQLSTKINNDDIYLYNIETQAWYRWTNLSCTALVTSTDSDRQRFYLGTSTGRVSKSFIDSNSDIDTNGNEVGIAYRLKTGVIFVDENRYSVKGFKKFALVYKPTTSSVISVLLKIDNYPIQSLSFTNINDGDVLGETFVLGSSVLGFSQVLAPFTQSMDGYGRGIQIDISQSGQGEATEIQGFLIEFEGAGDQQEVINE